MVTTVKVTINGETRPVTISLDASPIATQGFDLNNISPGTLLVMISNVKVSSDRIDQEKLKAAAISAFKSCYNIDTLRWFPHSEYKTVFKNAGIADVVCARLKSVADIPPLFPVGDVLYEETGTADVFFAIDHSYMERLLDSQRICFAKFYRDYAEWIEANKDSTCASFGPVYPGMGGYKERIHPEVWGLLLKNCYSVLSSKRASEVFTSLKIKASDKDVCLVAI